MEYHHERIDDLMKTYEQCMEETDNIKMPDIYEKIVNMPSRRFWVSDTRATVVVSAIMRGKDVLEKMWNLKREMYKEIYDRVVELKRKHPHMSLPQLCAIVVEQPAPKFYLTAGSAKIIICRVRKEWAKKAREKLLRLRLRSLS